MYVIGLTIPEIKRNIVKEWDNVYNLTFVTKVSNNEKTIIRMQYKCDVYNWRTDRESVKTYTLWLVMKNDKVHTHRKKYKTAKMAIGIALKEKPAREIRCQKAYDFDREIVAQAREYNDAGGNCSVRAFANIAHIPYWEARSICLKYGYNKGGMRSYKIKSMHKDYGIKLEDRTYEVRKTARTVKTFERQNFPGKWVIFVSGHVLASIDGVVTDWSAERNLRIEEAYKVA